MNAYRFRHGLRVLLVLGLSLTLAACVTVNIYFPAAAAQKLADQVVDQVYHAAQQGRVDIQTEPQTKATAPAASAAPSAWQQPQERHPGQILGYLTNVAFRSVSSTAHAAANLDASSPAVIAAKANVENQARNLGPYFASGAIGYTSNGLVAIHDAAAVPLAQRGALAGLVAGYNSALQNLYAQIADANGHPEWASQIQDSFARAWIAKAPAGYWYQGPSGQWQRK
ncbi:YdbL family protein [Acidithiobacillus sp. CV18-2]|uniref:YdbL family protein n=1 Tax=Igneacidithiobacillus copahuensis TaxID=2724909 RepID=A0AAE2YML8_9PROT|nr:YdbL family protein [Acidithiobacillus sp. CV18-3]MBU2756201.1 YdbL family protein [Acidithiobacillus sp. BN09-2]MBU2778646.1 YdbL family protein [Acidithiobacillus sp. CV18-2]MBU2786899.1 YdbL family protein [Igneacidithiobacillus copahuensis]MBU2797213.1 YdbL family protein [Acidithiobacillus sp. VAN18-2]MBU2798898.1 YdbL family protein [Acidithiobacillus sp. VAN18-4]UTV81439.1 YdbL family protein [Acidithiobacillus sp. YTS05]